ncbi:MAG: WbqC family protein [Ekhidna sp.]|uniref:WbqC family protein n=1 Tax=Ekhidna sp. TaxID=2608089 RepID=UPI0032EDFACC
MSVLTIEPHYLGSLEFFALLTQHSKLRFEIHDSFPKQTYRNRTYFLSSNKVQSLIVPVKYSNGQPTKEVTVDYSQRWLKDHWGAFYSSYGKAPFFEYFSEEFRTIWQDKPTHLIDLNMKFIQLVLKILQADVEIELTDSFERKYEGDKRNVINPKESFKNRKIYTPVTYTQLFGDTFVPNLSIIDLIMCEGPNAAPILSNSFLRN